MSNKISLLGPVDPSSLEATNEQEKEAPWIMRKLVGSMTGRIVMSSYESFRAMGTTVVCLSPWGDSSPLFLPCIRFRDLAIHTVIAATGGMAAVAAPAMGPISDIVLTSFGSSVLVELSLQAGFQGTTKLANELVFSKPVNKLIPIHSDVLETTNVKVLLITLEFKMGFVEDAWIGFFRCSLHEDISLFVGIKDYFDIEKGWFSPYLFASARRPVIPRNMKPDVLFCHGPFLVGDYKIGETLLEESALKIIFCDTPSPFAFPASTSSESTPPITPSPTPVPTPRQKPADKAVQEEQEQEGQELDLRGSNKSKIQRRPIGSGFQPATTTADGGNVNDLNVNDSDTTSSILVVSSISCASITESTVGSGALITTGPGGYPSNECEHENNSGHRHGASEPQASEKKHDYDYYWGPGQYNHNLKTLHNDNDSSHKVGVGGVAKRLQSSLSFKALSISKPKLGLRSHFSNSHSRSGSALDDDDDGDGSNSGFKSCSHSRSNSSTRSTIADEAETSSSTSTEIVPTAPIPRRMIILLIGLKPHRKIWSTSARPGESVINYVLFNGCPSLAVPVKVGCPLVCWLGLTLERIWKIELPIGAKEGVKDDVNAEGKGMYGNVERDEDGNGNEKELTFWGVVRVLFEFLDLCIDWDRMELLDPEEKEEKEKEEGDLHSDEDFHRVADNPTTTATTTTTTTSSTVGEGEDEDILRKKKKQLELRNALALLVASAIRTKDSKEVKGEVDCERAGIAMWRIP